MYAEVSPDGSVRAGVSGHLGWDALKYPHRAKIGIGYESSFGVSLVPVLNH